MSSSIDGHPAAASADRGMIFCFGCWVKRRVRACNADDGCPGLAAFRRTGAATMAPRTPRKACSRPPTRRCALWETDELDHVAASRIDLVQRRQPLFFELIGCPAADDLHPMWGRCALGLLLEHSQRQRERGHTIPADLLRIGQPAADEMRMRIVQTRHNRATARIDNLG